MHLLSRSFCGPGVQVQLKWGPAQLSRLSQAAAGCILIRERDWGRISYQAPSNCWLNSFPYSCILKGSSVLLAAGWMLVLEATCISWPPAFPGPVTLSTGG